MRPVDFDNPRAGESLKAQWLEYSNLKSEDQTSSPVRVANAADPLWNHVDRPVRLGPNGEQDIYRIRWKLLWTLEDECDIDEDWAERSLRDRKKKVGIRFSERPKNETFERMRKEKASVVSNLINLVV